MTTGLLQQLKRPTAVLVLSNFSSLGLGLISAALQARLLGPVGRGELATAIVPAGMAAMLLCIGLPDYFAREAAKGRDLRRLSLTAGVLGLSVGVVTVLPYLWVAQILAPIGTAAWYLLLAYACLTPITTFGYCLMSIAVGAGWWKTVSTAKLLPQAIAVVGLALLSVPGASPGAVGALLIASTVVGLLFPLTRRASWPFARLTKTGFTAALTFGFKGWPSGAIALLNQRIDLLLLTAMTTKEQLGYYAVATTLAAVLTAVSNSVAMPTRNRVARGEVNVVPQTMAATMAITALMAGLVIFALPILVNVVLGSSFLPAMPVMVVLLAAQIPLAGIVVMTQSLVGAGRPGLPFFGEVTALATTATIVIFMVPQFGTLSAAWANLAGNIVSFSALLFLSRKHVCRQSLWRYIFISPKRIVLILKGSA
ncbi:oligosaccharide flippase family protein [Arthrobacter sp. B10-11]|uniref:oligosaccharide flippase family protein n=1 Tax=Arthrobacter sp. B10-11 TaxID=3081160 RepID=UPI0029544A12|nr:oligosaccharide flippase family protein [Arthrobacter sp. B10-11]MDV8146989.1 oligosaccharide flippase family protein [Arthrobacter sp. B10-11]